MDEADGKSANPVAPAAPGQRENRKSIRSSSSAEDQNAGNGCELEPLNASKKTHSAISLSSMLDRAGSLDALEGYPGVADLTTSGKAEGQGCPSNDKPGPAHAGEQKVCQNSMNSAGPVTAGRADTVKSRTSTESINSPRSGHMETKVHSSSSRQWSFIKRLCLWGTISFFLCLLLCRVLLDTADTVIVRETFYADIPHVLYSLPVAAFGCALFLNISSWTFETHRSRQKLCVLVIFISGVAFLYELMALYGEAPIFLTQGGRPNSVMRYVMWSHATPAMVYALSMLSDLSPQRVRLAMVADVVMILAAIPGEYCKWWMGRYFFNTLSFLLFPFVIREIYTMFTQAMDATTSSDRQAYFSLKFLRMFTVVLWSVFPVVWALCQLNLIDSVMEEALHSIADVFGKIVFSSSLLQSNFVSIDARRRLALKAAEDANRTAVIFELQELLAQKEEFITVITHELRTPLNGIIGLSEALISAGALHGSNARSIGAIRNSGMRLLALVNDVLDAASMKRGTLTVQRKKVNIAKLIDDVIELTEALLSPGVRLITKVSAMTPLVIGDPQRLIQVMYNLVGNACKFTDEGEIVVECSGTVDDEFVVVKVKDTGGGIPEDRLADIFVPFSRGNMSESLRHGGTGLGLSVVKHIIEAHKGTISVESEVGVGSCFTFTIPSLNEENAGRDSIDSGGSDKSSEMWKRFSMDSEARKSFEFEKKMLKKAGQQIDPREALAVFTSSKAILPKGMKNSSDSEESGGGNTAAALRSAAVNPEPGSSSKNEEIEDFRGSPGQTGHGESNGHAFCSTTDPTRLKPSDSILRDVKDNLRTYRILSVDDDPVNQMVVQAMLKNKGFEVVTAADGERALSLIEQLHADNRLPEAILLDVMMPGLTGFEVVKRIRTLYPDWKVPVILVSAAGQKEKINEGIASGANAYIMKPLKVAELHRIIMHYISKQTNTASA